MIIALAAAFLLGAVALAAGGYGVALWCVWNGGLRWR